MNIAARKRLSQNTILDIYAKGGTTALRDVLARFPNAKPTLRKAVDRVASLGQDTTNLEALFVECFGVGKAFVTTYDPAVLGTPTDIANDNGITQAQVYIIARDREVEPDAHLRVAGLKGKGTALYNREEMKAEIAAFNDAKAAAFRETYDPAVEVSTADVAALLQSELGVDQPALVAGFLRLFNVPSTGKIRANGGRGAGMNVFGRATVLAMVEVVKANRLPDEDSAEAFMGDSPITPEVDDTVEAAPEAHYVTRDDEAVAAAGEDEAGTDDVLDVSLLSDEGPAEVSLAPLPVQTEDDLALAFSPAE